jgi:hypothetical protein
VGKGGGFLPLRDLPFSSNSRISGSPFRRMVHSQLANLNLNMVGYMHAVARFEDVVCMVLNIDNMNPSRLGT